MLTVADLMSSELFSVSADATLEDASFQLSAELMSGAPVREEDGTIVGIVSKSDIVVASSDGKPPSMMKVRDVMHRDVWSVTRDLPARQAAALMAERGAHRVMVADATGKPIGMLTSMDIVRAVADGKSFD